MSQHNFGLNQFACGANVACTTVSLRVCKWLLLHSDLKIPDETALSQELLKSYKEWINLVQKGVTRSCESAARVFKLIQKSMFGVKIAAEYYGYVTVNTSDDDLEEMKERTVCSLHAAISEAWNAAVERNDNKVAVCLTMGARSMSILLRAKERAVLVDSHGNGTGETAFMATFYSYLDLIHYLADGNESAELKQNKAGDLVIPHGYDLTVFVLENDIPRF